MPIGDLLAQISGDKASGSPAPAARRPDILISKRKADEDLHRNTSKLPRFTPTPAPAPTPTSTSTSTSTSRLARPPTTDAVPRLAAIPARPLSNGHRVSKPAAPVKRPPAPALSQPSEPLKPKAPPKKGSFAEILARGQRAQAVMGQVGKIQHKKVEKGAVKREGLKEEASRKLPATATAQGKRPVSGYSGTAKPALQRNSTAEGTAGPRNRVGAPASKPASTGKRPPAPAAAEAEKKVKKAILATTGYTGTARPRPDAPAKKSSVQRGGALLNPTVARARSSQRSRYEDDYDEELDDFIDYDDEEEQDEGGHRRYDYDSDASSDMEAGMDDIDDEERRAEHIARLEDLEQDRLEKTLKNAKEEKKRKALQALRANRR